MIWEVLLYGLGSGGGVYIALLSKKWNGAKRWEDVSFLQGIGLIAWCIGSLLALSSVWWIQKLSLPISLLTYVFFLRSLHVFPLASHATYERWKMVLDTLALIVTFLLLVIFHDLTNHENRHTPKMIYWQGGFYLLLPAISLLLIIRQLQGAARLKRGRLLLSTIMFIAVMMMTPMVPSYVMIWCVLIAFGCLFYAHHRLGEQQTVQIAHTEYRYLFERQKLGKQDAIMVQLILLSIVAMLAAIPDIPFYGKVGLGAGILFGLVRVYLTSRENHHLMNETLVAASLLEQKYENQLEQIQLQNMQLSRVLGLKQNYEYLLLASNEQSLREVNYETLQQVIEELVDTWFAKMDTLTFLQLSLESKCGEVYYRLERGTKVCTGNLHMVDQRVVVSEQRDTALIPRYVSLVAQISVADQGHAELEQSFFQVLLVNVRGLILRCLHEHQALELGVMETEMGLARRIQSMLIPKEEWIIKGLRARTVYAPITYVGGDYVDYIRIDDRYVCFIVADVSGHGLPASLLATGISSAARAVLQTSWSPDEILERLNQLLYENLSKTRSFITMMVTVYDSYEHKLLLSRAGHPQPLYLSKSKQSVLDCSGGVGLGLLPDSTYPLEEVLLKEEAILLIYTDGLVNTGRKDAFRCLQQWLVELSALLDEAESTNDGVIDRVESHVWGMTRREKQLDDMSVLILQFQSAPPI
ncbi:PP2C family protein-serine/threonine phosphatase [Brevibacillus reuszeri]|uniref:PP2C family protein-serine/threonine phosphatase n=1 Tax=Brevibacillus reuszeri TaxID=54915 RepID=UPI001F36B2B2|nr:PP2C family protein-serine/threonine phosphatase [Brevibacillus reuszeri]